ncbi:hypothetical protein APHAL10511_003347 [Amanita phalloides]|nr:hypothetical protein APHAL10511_003347 [Amanita phalloides]
MLPFGSRSIPVALYPLLTYNTCPYDLEEHHIDTHDLGITPLDYNETVGDWNLSLYDRDGYYEHQPEEPVCDSQHSSNSGSSQPNHAHFPPVMHIDVSTADGSGQHIGTSISHLHSEWPSISSYSELSAQSSYYNMLNSSSQQLGSAAASISAPTPTLATTPTAMATATLAAQPR